MQYRLSLSLSYMHDYISFSSFFSQEETCKERERERGFLFAVVSTASTIHVEYKIRTDNGSAVGFFFVRNLWQKAGGGWKSGHWRFFQSADESCQAMDWNRIEIGLLAGLDRRRVRFDPSTMSLSLSLLQPVRSKSISRCPRFPLPFSSRRSRDCRPL